MKIDGLDWMDWLHRARREIEEERKRSGQSELDWLKDAGARARAIKQKLASQDAPVARDREPGERS
jgi:hypothetical protein